MKGPATKSIDDAYTSIYARLLLPAYESAFRGRPTLRYLHHLDGMQWQSPEEIRREQLDALRALLVHAGANVPYYRETFAKARFDARGVKSLADLAALPVLTKDIIRERYDDLVDPAHRGENIKKGTSGSTGVPLKFEYSRESEYWRQATRMRGYAWSGYRAGMPVFFYWASPPTPPPFKKRMKIGIDRAMRREVYFDPLHQDDASRARAVAALAKTRPHVIICYAQACAQLARWVIDHDARTWPDIPVVCGAEPVTASDRAVMQRAFGPVFETYGARETMLIAAECDKHEGMHISEENLVVEVARGEAGVPLAPGEVGDVLITDLHNHGFPLIRYANGDLAVMSARTCSCGRGLRMLERIEGRRADTMRDAHGNSVPGILLHVLFSNPQNDMVRQFQLVQSATDEVVLRIVRGPGFQRDAFDKNVTRLRDHLRGLPVKVELVDAIAPGKNGKHRTVLVEPPADHDARARELEDSAVLSRTGS